MPTRDLKPEVPIRQQLHRLGLRYRIHRKDLLGKPDITFRPSKVAVFVDGCFWHGCPWHYKTPKTRSEWWDAKIDRNKTRDARKTRKLRRLGWKVVRVWEHVEPEKAAMKIYSKTKI